MNTIKNSQCVLVVAVICCVLLTLPNGAKANTIEYEKAAYLKVEDIIPTSLLKSNIYTIDAKVINDGLMNTYYVRSIDRFTL